ncbi:aldo/keto reductase [Actinoalloteichus hymeniacidonis]|uniref:Oxidoreductase, aryl-alcohol dehydrogenase like protein n=1 Tax=Actinoalloteichus hymeniacidonis TaxID=340345 RepID=A0AAC9HQV6_9PSEU|nr:aldo/keto reductase [Actinoalloteichus hymeniacidonis]AOS63581.1 putative oxidoreductase, aryl-alcohol dehydrogenase like protein [Actinoalloteichus hymeniacidonis]MBB5908373.1 aryl-alcohol dehydrogenase-like predicted oxidoreductase [Actinoalloteichus hymeniacidonis]
MRHRLLGRSGLRVSELFFGAMSFYENEGDAIGEYRAMLDAYAEAGGNVIDTASAYGQSEQILGELLAGRRDRFVLSSKYTISRDQTDPNAAGNHRKNLVSSLEQSLRRLRTDYLDLYWVHLWDRHTPIEETMRALDDAVRAGKILYVGISDAPAWLISRANTLAQWRDWTAFAAVQLPYNLLRRDAERELLPMAEALGLSVAAWGPLAGGVLSGKFSGGRRSVGDAAVATRVDAESLTEVDHTVAREVLAVAEELGVGAAQVALAWTRSRFAGVHPIVGARNVEQLTENLGAAGLVLSAEAVRRLSAAARFEVGFPGEFLAQCEANPWVFGQTTPTARAAEDTRG